MCHTAAHMATTRTKPVADTPLAEWLAAQLDERGWGVRTLARRINPDDSEIPRRTLNRCLYVGSYPSETNRQAIADALGVPVDEVPEERPFRDEAA
jgi:lambda repressor-like predicted transcriptional regulator